jgi:hypothetical protein
MNNAKLQRATESLNGVALRVLEAVPISEPWTVAAICSEVGRHGSRVDFNIVLGILNTHKTAGLVKEPMAQYFQRVHVPAPEPKAQKTAQVLPMPNTIAEREPLETISAFAAQLRASGRALIMWADDLERLGLEAEARVEAAKQGGEELQQLRQLKSLLASINSK